MGKLVGIVLFFCGVMGCLKNWMENQKEKQNRLDIFILFLQKSKFAMESENVKVIDYFAKSTTLDSRINDTLHEIAHRLSLHIYPDGSEVWKDVFQERKEDWNFDEECFALILKAGMGFFGRNKNENVMLLQKSVIELENQKTKLKEKNLQERKVWVPVSMLGGMMLMILFV